MRKLVAIMRRPCDQVARGFANFPKLSVYRREPQPSIMRKQVHRIRDVLRNYGAVVRMLYNGKKTPDGTFVYDHAFVLWILDRLFAFVPDPNWPRRDELALDRHLIEKYANIIEPPAQYQGKELRFDPGTVVQAPEVILVGYSRSRSGRTNKTGAEFVKAKLIELGYKGKIVLVQYIGLHLSTYCTSISTSEKPAPAFLVSMKHVKNVDAIRSVGDVILVDENEAVRANAIAHPSMACVILMKRWLPGKDKLLKTLLARGYKVEVVKLTESPCVQGSLHCHVLLLLKEGCKVVC